MAPSAALVLILRCSDGSAVACCAIRLYDGATRLIMSELAPSPAVSCLVALSRAAILMALAAVSGCGASTAETTAPARTIAAAPQESPTAEPTTTSATPNAGSSDGVTCEEARAQYVEQIDMQSGGPADLRAEDFGQVLNHGAYLEPCNVPHDSHIRICAAIREGAAVGVTVSLAPAASETEICLAKQVRGLAFPSHPKMDFVIVQF